MAAKKPHPKKRKKVQLSEKQVAALKLANLLRSKRIDEEAKAQDVVQVTVNAGWKKFRLTKAQRPACPKCQGKETKRHAMSRGRQRFRCRCGATFFAFVTFKVKEHPPVVCHFCGNTAEPKGYQSKSGAQGYCKTCDKQFHQGGPRHLHMTRVVLLDRIKALNLPEDVAAEVLLQATQDVLSGMGYTWSIKFLGKTEAYNRVRGNFSDHGSDSKVYKKITGQKWDE